MTMSEQKSGILEAIRVEISQRQRFLLSSHARPDGDSIGSQLAMAFALRALDKDVRIVNHDLAPASLLEFPGVRDIEIADRAEGEFDAAIILECSDLARTGVTGLDRQFMINIDHHPGNTMYGGINWFDENVAACGEMVFDVIEALRVPLTRNIATHIYLTILTDTGGFHYSGISARSFEICRRAVEAGVDPVSLARAVFDNNSLGRLKLLGTVLNTMELDPSNRLAVMYLDPELAAAAGATYDDTEGLINMPLTVKEVEAVAFFKQIDTHHYRVSLRSKGTINVAEVAKNFGGGGHKNASGFTVVGTYDKVKPVVVGRMLDAIQGKETSVRPRKP
jgi:bifunctional oligoribonuclease and PAP phosphatase NrnA